MTKQKIQVRQNIEIEVDLSQFSLMAIELELESRAQDDAIRLRMRLAEERRNAMEEANAKEAEWKRIPGLHSGDHHPLHSIYYAMKFGKPEHALDLMRDYLNDEFGVAL